MSGIRDRNFPGSIELKATTGFTDDGVFQEYTDLYGKIVREFTELRLASLDKAVRQKLIDLGWTPPSD